MSHRICRLQHVRQNWLGGEPGLFWSNLNCPDDPWRSGARCARLDATPGVAMADTTRKTTLVRVPTSDVAHRALLETSRMNPVGQIQPLPPIWRFSLRSMMLVILLCALLSAFWIRPEAFWIRPEPQLKQHSGGHLSHNFATLNAKGIIVSISGCPVCASVEDPIVFISESGKPIQTQVSSATMTKARKLLRKCRQRVTRYRYTFRWPYVD